MRHLAAYMLAKLSGIAEPSAADCAKILKGADVEVNEEAMSKIIEALKGKNYEELIAAGEAKMAKLSTAAAAPAAAAAAPAEEEKKKEKTEEEQIVAGFAFGADSSSSEEESS